MSVLNDTQIIQSSGGLVELGVAQVILPVTITSTTAGAGDVVVPPLTVVCDGSPVIIDFSATCAVGAGNQINVALYRDGAELQRWWIIEFANGANANQTNLNRSWRDTPSAGTHTYEVRAFRSNTNGTTQLYAGVGGTSSPPFQLRVSKALTAAQYPISVPGGVFVCTSSTRPAVPSAGQHIFETNTGLAYVYNGSTWIRDVQVDPATSRVPYSLLPSGSIVQVGRYGWTNETSVNGQGSGWVTATNSSYSFTPRFADSTLLIQFEWAMAPYYPSGNYAGMSCRGLWGGTVATYQTDVGHEVYASIGPSAPADLYSRTVKSASFTAGTTSPVAITSQVRAYFNTTTARLNQGGNWSSYYTVWEIRA